MVNDIAVQEFVKAIQAAPQDTNRTYNATVSHVDDEGVVWVNIHGSEKETPTASTSTEVKRGDAVTVQWRNNKLYIGGNYSNPSAGVVRVASVEQNAEDARLAAEAAEYNARLAQSLAEQNAITMANTVIEINNDIADLQNQIDGNITTWFYDYQPTTSNAPASTWTTVDEKNNHLGDLFYDTSTGYAYRWMSDGASTPTFSWSKITDTDVTTALATALAAQDTADHKRRVFITTPTVPYDVGDLWCEGTTGDILTCTHARTEAQSYSASDWSKLNKYTDDTRADEAYTLANTAKVSADGKNKIYRQATQPSDGTYVVGDIWFDTSHSNKIYRYSGSAWVAVTLGDDALESLSASKLTAGTIDASIITVSNLDAGNITTGTLAAERIGAGTITIGKMDSTAQSQILNSEITVGGRNYLKTNESFGYSTTGGGVTAVITGPSAFTFNGTATDTNIAFTDTKAFGGVELEAGEYMLSITPQTTDIRLRVGKGDSSTYLGLYDSPAQISITETDTYYVVPARISGKTYSASTEYKIKLEKGTKATDWTPAIEDVEKYTDDVTATLSDSLNSALSETASELSGSIDEVRSLASSKADATTLSSLSTQMQEYIGEGGYIYASNGTLIIATGENRGDFKIGITGQNIVFYERDVAVAYIEGKKMYITRSEVTDEQRISNFAFKKRDGGRFTLMYVGS